MNNEKKDSDKLNDKLEKEVAKMEARVRGLQEFMDNPNAVIDPLGLAHLVTTEIETPEEATVNHPPHYTSGNIECVDAIRSSMTDMEYQGYLKGNILEYLWRFRHKNGTEDLKSARWYLDKLIEAQGVI